MSKQQRLAVRIPVIGWEANILSENIERTRAKIANLSAGGAYLITEAEYQPGSMVDLGVKSSQISFWVTAIVLRNEPLGVAVRFLDLGESTKSCILEIVSRSLSGGKPESSVWNDPLNLHKSEQADESVLRGVLG
jgi:hypothetical protein